MKEEVATEELSLSKQRKIAKKKEFARRKRNAIITKVVLTLVILAVVGVIAYVIVKDQIKKAKQVVASTDYSTELNEDGTIKSVKASDYVAVPDYKNISVNLADIEYTDEKVNADIESILNDHMVVDNTEGVAAKDGDKVDITYVGKVDGVEFEGGSATNYGLTLGSNTFIDDYEAQIVGHTVGETFDVEVTFPEDYENNPDLAGKDAVFTVTLNGIYTKPEFNDEFVQEFLSPSANTAEEYRQYLKDTNYKSNLSTYVKDYLVNNLTVKSYPSDYLKSLKSTYKGEESFYYEYMNSLYSQYYGYTPYASFEDYLTQMYSQTEEQYDESLEETVSKDLKFKLACQAIAEAEGITASYDEAHEHYISEDGTEEDFNSQVETYGKNYMVQSYLCEKVMKMVIENTVVK